MVMNKTTLFFRRMIVACAFVLVFILGCMQEETVYASEVSSSEATIGDTYNTDAISPDFIAEYTEMTGDGAAPSAKTADYTDWLFAGWYSDKTCTDASIIKEKAEITEAWAKYVPSDLLTVKVQVKAGTLEETDKTNMRLVSSVDTLNYQKVGFQVEYHPQGGAVVTRELDVYTVYKHVVASAESGVAYQYNSKVVDTKSEWFMTGTMTNIGMTKYNDTFVIRAYWKTYDGTMVYGTDRYVKVSDAYNTNLINLPVKIEQNTDAATLLVTDAKVDHVRHYAGKDYADIMVDVTDRTTLASLTKYTVSDGQTAVWRNLESSLGTVTENVPTGDRTWYDVINDEKEFVIVTVADLYGFAEIVNATTNGQRFDDMKVYLGADITINEGTPTTADEWKTYLSSNPTLYKWNAIGTTKNLSFQGTFDGQGETIQGIYLIDNDDESKEEYKGLFGVTSTGSTLCDFRVESSYFESVAGSGHVSGTSCYAYLGSIVGELGGDMDTVYSDAVVTGGNLQLAGMVARTNCGAKGTQTISNCWFDGSVTLNKTSSVNYESVAGFVGALVQGNLTISDCLNSGSISYFYEGAQATYAGPGGFVGYIYSHSTTTNRVLTIQNSFNTGVVLGQCSVQNEDGTYTKYTGRTGAIVGNNRGNVIIDNVYATTESNGNDCGKHQGTITYLNDKKTVQKAASSFNGHTAYDNISLGLYNEETNPTGKWVLRETSANISEGSPVLKSFCDEWIDVAWYYNNKNDSELEISTVEELYGFSELSTVANAFSDKTVLLMKDIEINTGKQSTWASNNVEERTWTPIGATKTFSGTFDGNNHTISGLYVAAGSQGTGAGLFGQASGTIKNVKLINSQIVGNKYYTGSIVGLLDGNMMNVYSDAVVSSNAVEVGGLVGRFSSNKTISISDSWFAGSVIGTMSPASANAGSYAKIGGIVGSVDRGNKTIKNCLSTGTVSYTGQSIIQLGVGGLIGAIQNGSKVMLSECISTANLTGISDKTGADSAIGNIADCNNVTIENTYISTAVGNGIGLIASGKTVNGTPNILTTEQLSGKGAYVYTGLDFKSNDNSTGPWVAIDGQMPELATLSSEKAITSFAGVLRKSTDWYYNAHTYVGSTINTPDSYEIKTADDMHGLSMLVNSGKDMFSGATITLANDIVFNNAEAGDAQKWADGKKDVPVWTDENGAKVAPWTPIGKNGTYKFKGTFNGMDHIISGLYMNVTQKYSGLFGVADGATIQNVRLENSYLISTNEHMGSIVGYGGKIIENVYSNAIMEANGIYVGGLIGNANNLESLTSCWFDGSITALYSGKDSLGVGGLIGRAVKGTVAVDTCLYTGSISVNTQGASKENPILGIGGICGYDNGSNASVQIKNSLSDGNIHFVAEDVTTKIVGYGSLIGNVTGTTSNVSNCVATTIMKYTMKAVSGETKNLTNAVGNQSTMTADNTWRNQEQYIYGLGGQMWTNLAFKKTDRTDGGPIWAAVKGSLPVPATLASNALEITVDKPNTDLAGSGTIDDPWQIHTIADWAGFAELSQSRTFAGEYVKLMNDIVINEGEKAEDWVNGEMATLPWYEHIIGQKGYLFAGTFDGNGKSISGISLASDAQYLGLFYATDTGSEIKDFRLENSYIKQQSKEYFVGSIAGELRGNLDTVYSNAIVDSVGTQIGGLVGRVNVTGTTVLTSLETDTSTSTDEDGNITINKTIEETVKREPVSINNCWFDGHIQVDVSKSERAYIGGIAGRMLQGTANVSNCLVTGVIDSTATTKKVYVGGLFGEIAGYASSETKKESVKVDNTDTVTTIHTTYVEAAETTVNISSTIVANNISSPSGQETQIGAVVGLAYGKAGNVNIDLQSVFTTIPAMNMKDQVTVTGEVVRAASQDRLMGYGTQQSGETLDFVDTWMMRTNGVPILKCFSEMVDDQTTLMSSVDASLLAQEIGLNHWDVNAKITDAKATGEGDYLVTYECASKTNYDEYLTKLADSDTGLGFEQVASNQYTDGENNGLVYSATYSKEANAASGEWVLNLTYVVEESKIYISINTDVDSISDNLIMGGEVSEETSPVSLSMLELKKKEYG